MSADLQWMLIRNNSCFLVKSLGMTLTKEPNNIKKLNCFKGNGLVHSKAVSVEAAADGKGVVLSMKRKQGKNKPVKMIKSTTIKRGGRHTVKTIKNTLGKSRYRSDLMDAASRRACAIIKSQSTSAVVKKKRSHRKRN
ncbi:large ribosomal subunit protein eL28-like [Rhopilema esculentum]|uniref:large ribosomal subunit protein eL28-like n=1 Tax=Rhopilema esculentum TaxID=499914 RepID=UPI0031D1B3D1|eukprot:gene10525-19251_t